MLSLELNKKIILIDRTWINNALYHIISTKKNKVGEEIISLGWSAQTLSLERKHPQCTGRKIWLRSSPKIQQPVGSDGVQRKDPRTFWTSMLLLSKISFYKRKKRKFKF